MLKKIILFCMVLGPTWAHAMQIECGDYRAIGSIKRTLESIEFIVNKGSASEYVFTIPEKLWPKVVPYIDQNAKLEFKITNKIVSYKANISEIISAERGLLESINEINLDQLKLLTKAECAQ